MQNHLRKSLDECLWSKDLFTWKYAVGLCEYGKSGQFTELRIDIFLSRPALETAMAIEILHALKLMVMSV